MNVIETVMTEKEWKNIPVLFWKSGTGGGKSCKNRGTYVWGVLRGRRNPTGRTVKKVWFEPTLFRSCRHARNNNKKER